MATEKLLPNGDDGGWPTGTVLDVDEGIAVADGSFMATTIKDDVVRYNLGASVIVDGDTVTRVDITIRGRTNGSGSDSMRVALVIDGTPRVQVNGATLGSSFGNETLNDADWNQDWTAAQMDGAQVDVTSRQSGMPATVGHELDCFDVDPIFTPAGGAGLIEPPLLHSQAVPRAASY